MAAAAVVPMLGLCAGRASAGTDPTVYLLHDVDRLGGIITGPDGALWFTDDKTNTVDRITTTGTLTSYSGIGIDYPEEIVEGPDGALWFTNNYNDSIGRITTAGVVTNYTGRGIDGPSGIIAGPDGALWFTNSSGNSIGRITTAGVVSDYQSPAILDPQGITVGSDGALWYANADDIPGSEEQGSVGRITTAGVVTNTYSLGEGSLPGSVAQGPDGAIWVGAASAVDRVTTNGVVTSYPAPHYGFGLGNLVPGLGHDLWLGDLSVHALGRITTAGSLTEPKTPNESPQALTIGPDGALWATADVKGQGMAIVRYGVE